MAGTWKICWSDHKEITSWNKMCFPWLQQRLWRTTWSVVSGTGDLWLQEMAAIVHTATSKSKKRSRGNAVVQYLATTKRSGQLVFTYGAEYDRSVQWKQRWSVDTTKKEKKQSYNKWESKSIMKNEQKRNTSCLWALKKLDKKETRRERKDSSELNFSSFDEDEDLSCPREEEQERLPTSLEDVHSKLSASNECECWWHSHVLLFLDSLHLICFFFF